MKLTPNKYLDSIGINHDYWLFKDVRNNQNDKRYTLDENGFIDAEFWNLDNTLSMVIYSYLSRFIDKYAVASTPAFMSVTEWTDTLNKMRNSFELLIKTDTLLRSKEEQEIINTGLELFVKYLEALWV